MLKVAQLTLTLGMALCSSAYADGKLRMTGPDSAVAHYNDRCSNGANITESVRNQFIENMLANPQSQLGSTIAKLSTFDEGFQLTKGSLSQWTQSFHLRSGCGTSQNSFTAIVLSLDVMSNSNVAVAKYLVTVDDDDEDGVRTLKLRSIQALDLRQED